MLTGNPLDEFFDSDNPNVEQEQKAATTKDKPPLQGYDVLKGSILHRTEKAILIRVDNFREVWIPLSLVGYIKLQPEGSEELDILHVTTWYLNKNKLRQ